MDVSNSTIHPPKSICLPSQSSQNGQTVSAYSFASLSWHLIQGLPLILWPQAINGLLTIDGETMHPSNSVENYFARSLGLTLVALGMVTVVLTGSLPLNSLVECK